MIKGPDDRDTRTRGSGPGDDARDRHVIHADFSHRGHAPDGIHAFADAAPHGHPSHGHPSHGHPPELTRAGVTHSGLTPREGDAAGAPTSDAKSEAEREAQRAAASDEMQRLRVEHRDLDAAIDALGRLPCDQLQLQRLKRRKLALRDRIRQLEDQITPDIIA